MAPSQSGLSTSRRPTRIPHALAIVYGSRNDTDVLICFGLGCEHLGGLGGVRRVLELVSLKYLSFTAFLV